MEIIIIGNFKEAKNEIPVIQEGLTVKVYFIVDNVLYKGTYHRNGHFYAYEICGGFDCFASATGEGEGWNGKFTNDICTHWCYVDDLKIEIADRIIPKLTKEEKLNSDVI